MTQYFFDQWNHILRCPECFGIQTLINKSSHQLGCQKCSKNFECTHNYVNLLTSSSYGRSIKKIFETSYASAKQHLPTASVSYDCHDLLSRFGIDIKDFYILDVGSGINPFTKDPNNHNSRIAVLDILDQQRFFALNDSQEDTLYLQASVMPLPFHSESFDLVQCQHTLPFAPQIKKSVKELQRVTKKEGFLYISYYAVPQITIYNVAKRLRHVPPYIQSLWSALAWAPLQWTHFITQYLFKKYYHDNHYIFPFDEWMLPNLQVPSFKELISLFSQDHWAIKFYQNNFKIALFAQKRTEPITKLNISHKDLQQGTYEIQQTPTIAPLSMEVEDFTCNILYQLGSLDRPLVSSQEQPLTQNSSWYICLTHDIDWIKPVTFRDRMQKFHCYLRHKESFHNYFVKKYLSKAYTRQCIPKVHNNKKNIDTLHDLITFEESRGIRSTLFVFPEQVQKTHRTDCFYRYDDTLCFKNQTISFKEFLLDIHKNGWDIGLHASWTAATDYDELIFQKEQLENTLQTPVVSIRYHYLRYIPGITEKICHQAGFLYDSTIGFNHTAGFRRGTSKPWILSEAPPNMSHSLYEFPLILHDNPLFNPKYTHYRSWDEGIQESLSLIDACKAEQGVATLLWHLYNQQLPNPLMSYKKILDHYMTDPHCRMGSIHDIAGTYFQSRPQMDQATSKGLAS